MNQTVKYHGTKAPVILLVEDDSLLRHSIRLFLELRGFDVLEASGLLDLHSVLSVRKPDLVLCDYLLGDRRGSDVLAQLRADPELSPVPFIMMTCMTERGVMRQCMELGCDDFITKPVSADELIKAVEVRLHLRGVRGVPTQGPRTLSAGGETAQTANPIPRLSRRECEVLKVLSEGLSNEEIALSLGISSATVKRHIINIFGKMNCKSRLGAVAQFYGNSHLRDFVEQRTALRDGWRDRSTTGDEVSGETASP